jgi:membrane dipeptidase
MWDQLAYNNLDEAAHLLRGEYDLYRRLADESPEKFSLVRSRKDLQAVLAPWEQSPADYPNTTHPVGLVLLLEGAEGLRAPDELEEWWHMGLRLIGPVWAGTRFCGGSYEPGGFTPEGRELLEVMGSLGYTLDIAHMTEESALQAMDQYEGPVVATHANARALLKGDETERHLSNRQIQRLLDRDGLIGILPFNRFLKPSWSPADDPESVTLEHVAAHIDHICQMAGDALHVGIGTDFDGGFGYGAVPQGIDTIADMQKLVPVLQARGYAPADIDNIMGGNWRKFLERTLPES